MTVEKGLAPVPVPENALLVPTAEEVAAFSRMKEEFARRTRSLGHDLSRYYWYHTVDLGDGLVTPGEYDYRSALSAFAFPEDMKGMRVLDVGSATGYFAFEFERRGAQVTSVDIPSIVHWDQPTEAGRRDLIRSYLEYFGVATVDEVQRLHLDGPFKFCHDRLRSKVMRQYSTIYDLKRMDATFDLVFVGDVLLHLISPLEALASVAHVCGSTLIIAQGLDPTPGPPTMRFLNAADAFWLPTYTCLEQMLNRVGFGSVSLVGQHTGFYRREWVPYRREIVHARKG